LILFCTLKGIIELKKRGVYASTLIKKCKYWPKYIHGDDAKKDFGNKEVGKSDAQPGKMNSVPFHVFCLKEPDYVMSPMSTYARLSTFNQRETSREYNEGNATTAKNL